MWVLWDLLRIPACIRCFLQPRRKIFFYCNTSPNSYLKQELLIPIGWSRRFSLHGAQRKELFVRYVSGKFAYRNMSVPVIEEGPIFGKRVSPEGFIHLFWWAALEIFYIGFPEEEAVQSTANFSFLQRLLPLLEKDKQWMYILMLLKTQFRPW